MNMVQERERERKKKKKKKKKKKNTFKVCSHIEASSHQ